MAYINKLAYVGSKLLEAGKLIISVTRHRRL